MRKFALAFVLATSALLPAAAEAQGCPVGSKCWYVPAAQPNPSGFSGGDWDAVLSTPTGMATGTYTINGGAPVAFNVMAGTPFTIPLSANEGVASTYNSAESRGIFIVSDQNLDVVRRFVVGPWQHSATIKPSNIALGTRFRAGGYGLNRRSNANTGHDMVAVYAPTPTMVTFTAPPGQAAPYWQDGIPGLSHTVSLAAGQTYLIRALENTCDNEIDGALITSTAPIAVVSGGRGWAGSCGVAGSCGDEGEDMVLPTSTWGTEFIVRNQPGADNAGEDVRIVADTANTTVRINGMMVANLVNPGDVYTHTGLGAVDYIETTEPVAVFHNAARSGCETGLSYVPPAVFTVTPVSVSLNVSGTGTGTVVIPTASLGSLQVDGAAPTTIFNMTVPGRADLTVVQFTLAGGDHTVSATSDFHLALVSQTGGTGLYAYYNPFRVPGCGDGTVDAALGEACDDGNLDDSDMCSSTCKWTIGNGPCMADGDCVPTGRCDAGVCVARCTTDMDCADGNECTNDSCDVAAGTCANDPVNSGTACAAGSCNPMGVCEAICGNGALEGSEECDDGNDMDGDGCSSACVEETGFVCTNQGFDETGTINTLTHCDAPPGGALNMTGPNWAVSAGAFRFHYVGGCNDVWGPGTEQFLAGGRASVIETAGGARADLAVNPFNTGIYPDPGGLAACEAASVGDTEDVTVMNDGQLYLHFEDNPCTDNNPMSDVTWRVSSVSVCVAGCADASDCPGAVPICDTSTMPGSCVECQDTEMGADQDMGCSAMTPICDTTGAAPTCVTCLDDMMSGSFDTGCGMGMPVCDDATDPHSCIVCVEDRDCPMGVCDTSVAGGACVPCRDSAGAGMQDAGCLGATPICDISGDPNECVECTTTADCSGGVCNTTTNTCVECTDDQPGAVPDGGCATPTSYCDDSDPMMPTCVECTEDSQCTTGVCDTDANTCVVCVDSATGAADSGCSGMTPVCDTSVPAGQCVPCENDQMTGMDFGCDGSAPTCDEMAAGGATCVACADTMPLGGTDDGCDSDTPACDEGASGGPECVVCLDDQAGGFNDSGCPADSPVCDDMGATPSCHPCLDSTTAGGRDNGCPSGTPTCDESEDPNVCVECLSNDDCPGGACDTDSNTCAACVDDEMGAEDSGCGDPRPVCDGDSGTCLPCEDTGDGTDFGCDSSSPICDESDPSNPECVECEGNDDCMSGVCDAMTSTCVGCINDAAMGTDSGCMGTENICDAEMGASGMCVECINTTSGMTDDGCAVTSPVCDGAPGEAGECTTCEDTSMSSGDPDNGCPLTAPICDTSTAGGTCVECEENTDCTTGACDTATNTCVACVDDTMGMTDTGCSAATPVCDLASDPANPTCVACEDSATGAATDNGCEDPRSVCDEDAAAGPTCVSCVDDMSGGMDTGCGSDAPVCFTDGAEPECVTCEDSMSDPDFGCADPTSICDVTTPGSPSCIECGSDDDCSGDTPVCNTSGTCVPGCNDDGDCPMDAAVCDTEAMACVECTDSVQCPGEEPVCDPTTNTCVECVMDDDCPDATMPVCDMGEQVCVECTGNGDCPMGVCDTLSDSCVGCVTNEDCPGATPVCDPTMGECVECLSNSECPEASPICSETTSTCVECVRGGDCPSGMCELSTGTCTGPECVSNNDCIGLDPNEPVCDVGTCVECLATGDCGESEICDVANKVCVPGCEDDDDCEGATVCLEDAGVCVECTETSDCSDEDVCNVSSNTCGPACDTDDDCESEAGLLVCDTEQGVCVECLDDIQCADSSVGNVCGEDSACVQCVEDADCPVGVCAAFGECVECDSDDDCPDDAFCDVAATTCSDDCESNSDCMNPALSLCDEDTGSCEECLEHGDCADMEVCTEDNICQPGCMEDEECPSDAPICQTTSGTCVECAGDDDCEDGLECDDDFVCVEPGGPRCESDEDCEGATAFCDTDGGLCVACLEDEDCDDEEVCTSELSCAAACEDDEDCDDDEVCTDEGFCAPGEEPGCESDDDCEDSLAGTVCLDSGVCGCDEDDACLEDLECNTDAEYCGCADDSDCDEGETCDPDTRTCESGGGGDGGLSGGSCAVSVAEAKTSVAPWALFAAVGLVLFRRRRD